jgi:HEAT repeat protein
LLIELGLRERTPEEPVVATEVRPAPDSEVASSQPDRVVPSLEEANQQLDASEPDGILLSLEEAIRQFDAPESGSAGDFEFKNSKVVQSTVPEDIGEAIVYWIAGYRDNPVQAGRGIRALAVKAPERVAQAIIPMLREDTCGDATPLLVSMFGRNNAVLEQLCDPASPIEDSVRIIKTLVRHDPLFDVHFGRILLADEHMSDDARYRGLVILEGLGSTARLIPVLIQFLRHHDARARSKAALLLGLTPTQGLIERLMRDEDPRVRANFLEGLTADVRLWSRGTVDLRPLLRQALNDSNNRVVGNALVGLHRCGEHRDIVRHLARMVQHPEAAMRATAAWVMGQTGEKRYTDVLRHLARDTNPMVRRNALRSLEAVGAAKPSECP